MAGFQVAGQPLLNIHWWFGGLLNAQGQRLRQPEDFGILAKLGQNVAINFGGGLEGIGGFPPLGCAQIFGDDQGILSHISWVARFTGPRRRAGNCHNYQFA